MGIANKILTAAGLGVACGYMGFLDVLGASFDAGSNDEVRKNHRRAAVVWPLAWVLSSLYLIRSDTRQELEDASRKDAWVARCMDRSGGRAGRAACEADYREAYRQGRMRG